MILILLLLTSISVVQAESYAISEITHIYSNDDGSMGIKWAGSPRPSLTCGGENYGWAYIPSTAPNSMKSLAISIHIANKPATVVTSGCNGAYEIVKTLYTPSG